MWRIPQRIFWSRVFLFYPFLTCTTTFVDQCFFPISINSTTSDVRDFWLPEASSGTMTEPSPFTDCYSRPRTTPNFKALYWTLFGRNRFWIYSSRGRGSTQPKIVQPIDLKLAERLQEGKIGSALIKFTENNNNQFRLYRHVPPSHPTYKMLGGLYNHGDRGFLA